MVSLPNPPIERHGRVLVVRDDVTPGGTKRRVIDCLLQDGEEFVYASPAFGFAQIALAYACRDCGKRATIFTAKRGTLHARTQAALDAGARIEQVAPGYLSTVQARAREYSKQTGARLLEFGLSTPPVVDRIAAFAASLNLQPAEVWAVVGSGTLLRGLQAAWPAAQFNAVRVGKDSAIQGARVFIAPESFEKDAEIPPPFPSCSNYDAKAWRFIEQYASDGALFWNVAP